MVTIPSRTEDVRFEEARGLAAAFFVDAPVRAAGFFADEPVRAAGFFADAPVRAAGFFADAPVRAAAGLRAVLFAAARGFFFVSGIYVIAPYRSMFPMDRPGSGRIPPLLGKYAYSSSIFC